VLAGVSLDNTSRKLAEHRLLEADARKDEFLAMLAHELRNPLAPLANALHVLQRRGSMDETDRRMMEMAVRQVRQLRRLVDDLLEVGRITRGKIELRREPMDVAAAVRAASESVGEPFAVRGQRLALLLPPEPVRVVADPARIAQVLGNLLNNASKYTPEGGSVSVEVRNEADAVVIRVSDDGIGLEAEKIPLLFELFSQIDATIDRSQGGLGIGLAMVRRLVELHGGSVVAESPGLGRGSTFTVRLPRVHGDAVPAAAG
jgi:signal transduction histidine kinase